MTDLQWEFLFTCWKYNVDIWRGGTFKQLKFSLGAPFYYHLLAKKLFGPGVKYPLYRFAGFPEKFFQKHLYLNLSGYKRDWNGLKPFEREILPSFKTTTGLNMVDASELVAHTSSKATLEVMETAG